MQWTPKLNPKYNWHKWYAWHPVKIFGTWYWLEYVQRKYEYDDTPSYMELDEE